ncbi:acyl carrier protein [Pseudomonas sp. ESBL9]|uniref:acyl carrier protein n=1 Tax=Pseudomonas sp. ESBL9 TaxID=3077327 RepID=UPI002FCB6709
MTDLKHHLRDELAALLDMDPALVSTTAYFDELGVDSLIALRFARKVHDLTNIEIDVECVLENPTLAQLAVFVDTQLNDVASRTALLERVR